MNPKWDGQKQIVVYKGLLAKFAQNEIYLLLLLDTVIQLLPPVYRKIQCGEMVST